LTEYQTKAARKTYDSITQSAIKQFVKPIGRVLPMGFSLGETDPVDKACEKSALGVFDALA
jgi:hypothetical protein